MWLILRCIFCGSRRKHFFLIHKNTSWKIITSKNTFCMSPNHKNTNLLRLNAEQYNVCILLRLQSYRFHLYSMQFHCFIIQKAPGCEQVDGSDRLSLLSYLIRSYRMCKEVTLVKKPANLIKSEIGTPLPFTPVLG